MYIYTYICVYIYMYIYIYIFGYNRIIVCVYTRPRENMVGVNMVLAEFVKWLNVNMVGFKWLKLKTWLE